MKQVFRMNKNKKVLYLHMFRILTCTFFVFFTDKTPII